MALFSLIVALFVDRAQPLAQRNAIVAWFYRYADRVARNMNAGEPVHGTIGWLVAVGPWMVLAFLLHILFYRANPLLGLLWNAAVLYACIGFQRINASLEATSAALKAGDLGRARELVAQWRETPAGELGAADTAKLAIETALVRAHREGFGVIFWFAVLSFFALGPAGAVLYRLAGILAQRWGTQGEEENRVFGRFATRALQVLDWIPARLTAIAFAIAGNFEDAASAWRGQAVLWLDRPEGIVLASGAGALGVQLGGTMLREGVVDYRPELGEGAMADADHVQSTIYFLRRALIAWIAVFVLLAFAQWAGRFGMNTPAP